MSTNEMSAKLRELKELKAFAEQISKEIAEIENAIKTEMTTREVDALDVDIYKVRWQVVESARFDSSGFKAAMPELYKQFTKKSTSRRFVVA